jgi:predicted TIM-barrel fold metal-dependent hydrolase
MFDKRLEGRSEPVILPEIPIIDAHVHLYQSPVVRYLIDDYLADAKAGHNIRASVHVEIQAFARKTGPEAFRPLGEIEYANGVGAMGASGVYGDCQVAAGIVGHVDLRQGEIVEEVLDRSMTLAPERFKGVRQVANEHPSEAPYRFITHRPPRGLLTDARFLEGFRHLAPRGLSFDASVFHNQLPDVARLASTFADTTIILDHVGIPVAMDMDASGRSEVFVEWRTGLRALAQRPNVLCKISGLGLPYLGFDFIGREEVVYSADLAAAWKPYIDEAIEAFGPHRCMMASNFPQDGRSCGFVPLWNALKRSVNDLSADEKDALFFETASRAYRLNVARTA